MTYNIIKSYFSFNVLCKGNFLLIRFMFLLLLVELLHKYYNIVIDYENMILMSSNIIIPKLNNNQFYKALLKICDNPQLSLFHDAAKITIENMEQTCLANLDEIASVKGYNHLFVNNAYYALKDHTNFLTVRSGKLESVKDKKPDLVMKIISTIQQDIANNNKNTKYIKFYREFFEYDNAKHFLSDYLSYAVIVSARYTYKNSFKLTNLSINICETILRFIIAQIPLLKLIEKCFNLQESLQLSPHQIQKIIKFAKLILNSNLDNQEVITIFKTFNIQSRVTQENIWYYFYVQFYAQYDKNTIYISELKEVIKNSYNVENTIKYINIYKQHCLSTGYFLLDAFIYREMFTITTHIRYRKPCKYLVIAPKIVEQLTKEPVHQKPFLSQKQLYIHYTPKNFRNEYEKILYENLTTFIHDNPRIKINIKDNCYLHDNKLYTKFSIDIDYLTEFLNMLNNGLKQEYLFSLFNINISKLNHLKEQHASLGIIIDNIILRALDFTQNFTTSQIKTMVKKEFERMIRNAFDLEDCSDDIKKEFIDQIKTMRNEYLATIIDILNIVFQRKVFLIKLINESITYSIYKFFIYSSYLDTRSRIYDASTALNINNNPIAKLFVKLYDENEGSVLNEMDLPVIKNCLIHKQTQEKLDELSQKDLKKENIKEFHKYIKNYLNIDDQQYLTLIKSNNYHKKDSLLDFLYTNIKKPKHLFYVHSLINYEQLRFRNKNIQHFCNYYQKDASSSGLQMMSILYRNPELAKMSNLSGNDNYDIYSKATEHVFEIFNKLRLFSNLGCRWFELEEPLNITVSFQTYYQRVSFNNDAQCFSILLNIDFDTSSISRDLLYHIINRMINNKEKYDDKGNIIPYPIIDSCQDLLIYLPSSYTTLINDFSKLDDFKDNINIIEYLFCLRYATRLRIISETYLGIQYDKNSLWFSRELTKNHVMTLVYMSTSYGRKQHYISLLKDISISGYSKEKYCRELAAFLDKTATRFLESLPLLKLIYNFVNDICHDEKIIIKNRNFTITFDPRITKDFQVSCSSFKRDKRGPQLVIKKLTNKLDSVKLKSMFMANLAHTMDSDLMHHFIELCLNINSTLGKNKCTSRLSFQRNHDCFILNYAPLLSILIEEAYLRLSSQNNIAYINNIPDALIEKFTTLTPEEFLSLLTPINPNFIK